MKRTPLEIKKHQFNKSLRGYDPDEVHSFLSLLSNEWEHLIAENRQIKKETAALSDKLKHYQHIEEAIQETLQTARTSSGKKIESAGKEADDIRAKARKEAEQIVQNANEHYQKVQQQVLLLTEKRDEMIQTLRSYLEQTTSSLDDFSDLNRELFQEVPEENELDIPEPPSFKPLQDTDSDTIPGSENIDDILDQID